jgi:hypothetical protein
LNFGFQCTNNFADAGKLSARIEPTFTSIKEHHTLYLPLAVSIQVRPGCPTPWIAPGDPHSVPATILGSSTLDVTKVDLASLRLAGVAATPAPTIADVNADGRPDISATFPMAGMKLTPGGSGTVTLTGALTSSRAIVGKQVIAVVATAGPKVSVTPGYAKSLWPPNHNYVSYDVKSCITKVLDQCGKAVASPTIQLVKAQSDEVDASEGTTNDMKITGATTVDLRAEREGGGDGRVYTLTFTVSDADGSSNASCKLEVRHDPPHPAVDSGVKSCVGTCP